MYINEAHAATAKAGQERLAKVLWRTISVNMGLKTPRTAVINQTMARRFFAGEEAVGKRIAWGETLDQAIGEGRGEIENNVVLTTISMPRLGSRSRVIWSNAAPKLDTAICFPPFNSCTDLISLRAYSQLSGRVSKTITIFSGTPLRIAPAPWPRIWLKSKLPPTSP